MLTSEGVLWPAVMHVFSVDNPIYILTLIGFETEP